MLIFETSLYKSLRNLQRSGSSRRRRQGRLSGQSAEVLERRQLLSATGIQAFHRSGQTFLTWNEDSSVSNEQYHIYRHTAQISSGNLGQAQKLTSQWGPLDDDTSVHSLAGPGAPANFVINDLAAPLAGSKGLFVFTTPNGGNGTYYYAVTQVTNGSESLAISVGSNSLVSGVSEVFASPQPVLVASQNGGKGRVYTQFMDYDDWNPTFQGYAYNYSVALPFNYDPGTAWPLKLNLHAYSDRYVYLSESEYEWPAIEVFVDDPGFPANTVATWWYGFSADHNYNTNGPIPSSGRIENFTEQRVLKAVDEVIQNSDFNVDTSRIHAQGHSMGASGAISLALRYGDVFSAVYASQGMTNYGANPGFQADFAQLWGSQASNLAIVNGGPHASHLAKYADGGSDPTGVWDWQNHQEQIVRRRGENMAFLMFGHGKDDDVIDWATQGRPFIAAVNAANIGFTAEQRDNYSHNWMGFEFANHDMMTEGYGDLGDFIFRSDYSFPGIQNATQSGPNVPGSTGTDFYNLEIDWSVPWNSFHTPIMESNNRYEISLRSRNGVQTADITPRNLQQFQVIPGQTYSWSNTRNSNSVIEQSGTVTADADGLLTIPNVTIRTGDGNRLIIENENTVSEETIGETGIATNINHNWKTITLTQNYQYPVIIPGPVSTEGSHSGALRIRNVTSNSFEVRFQEWDYLDGNHVTESFSFVVVEAGIHYLADGTKLFASTAMVDGNWKHVNATFSTPPIILTHTNSTNGGAAVLSRVRKITNTGFKVQLREEEAADQYHYLEKVGYIAIEAGDTDAGGTFLRAIRTPDAVGNEDYTFDFGQIGSTSQPIVLAGLQSLDGGDTVNIRRTGESATSIDMFLQEEQSYDSETRHTFEVVGLLAMEPGLLRKPSGGGSLALSSIPHLPESFTAVPEQLSALDKLFSSDEDELFGI